MGYIISKYTPTSSKPAHNVDDELLYSNEFNAYLRLGLSSVPGNFAATFYAKGPIVPSSGVNGSHPKALTSGKVRIKLLSVASYWEVSGTSTLFGIYVNGVLSVLFDATSPNAYFNSTKNAWIADIAVAADDVITIRSNGVLIPETNYFINNNGSNFDTTPEPTPGWPPPP